MAVLAELGADRAVALEGVLALLRLDRDDVQEHPAALDAGEETVAEAGARMGALDQARDVGDHDGAVGVV